MEKADLTFFDCQADLTIVHRRLPHWSQAGCICFVTWRLNDSLPAESLQRIDQELQILRVEQDPTGHSKQNLGSQCSERRDALQWKLFLARDKFLDQGYGSCHLADPRCSAIVLESLKKFDTERYFLTDAVVMPNHAHFMCAFPDEERFLKQCSEWKRYTGREINRILGLRGEFWQVDQFDHLIRSPEQFQHYRQYLANNPREANLPLGSFLHFQKQL